jgi:diacylglycerol kinase (ATP)
MSRKLLFIINPKSGKKLGPSLPQLIKKGLQGKFEFEIWFWNKVDDFEEIPSKLESGNYSDVVAVGGDGTVNMVAKAIVGSGMALGILPAGSGNGLARSLMLPMNPIKALDCIVNGKTQVIDSGTVNGKAFFCTSGLGFDAHVGHLFAESVKRGLSSYVKIIWNEFRSYQAMTYKLRFNGNELERKAFLITVANAGQYGNNFYIAPKAKLQDGLFHVVLLQRFKFFQVFSLLFWILIRRAHRSKLIETFTCDQLLVERPKKDVIHFDGEPALAETILEFSCVPSSLKAIVGPNFKAV